MDIEIYWYRCGEDHLTEQAKLVAVEGGWWCPQCGLKAAYSHTERLPYAFGNLLG